MPEVMSAIDEGVSKASRLPYLCRHIRASVRAELPPSAYNKLRIDAEEAVTIEVTGVQIALMGGDKNVTVEAKVLGVERSKNGLKKGDSVTFRYDIPAKPPIGPAPPPLLEKVSVYPAFLNKKGAG